jgi:hypothetical protein
LPGIRFIYRHRLYELQAATWRRVDDNVIPDQRIIRELETRLAAEYPEVPRQRWSKWDGRYHVYAIELSRRAGRSLDPSKPIIYVGQSALPPKERFEQHMTGIHAARIVHKYGVGLRLDLVRGVPLLKTREDALRWEAQVARDLAQQLYTVKGGH